MDWTRQIDNYCERTGPEFWSEPWNAVTNASFIIAAVVVLLIALRARRLDGPVAWLTLLIAAIGIGSFLFHTYAQVWSVFMDVVPIFLFILSYFTIAMRCFVGVGWGRAVALTAGFLVAMIAVSWVLNTLLRDVLGGSISYIPAMLALVTVGLWLRGRGHPAGVWLISVAALFAVSLTFRTLDHPEGSICAHYHVGTHWMWHILNGVVLGALTVALIRHGTLDADTGKA